MDVFTNEAGVSIAFRQINAQTRNRHDLGEVLTKLTLGIEFLNLEGGSQDRVKILHISVSNVVCIQREDLY